MDADFHYFAKYMKNNSYKLHVKVLQLKILIAYTNTQMRNTVHVYNL